MEWSRAGECCAAAVCSTSIGSTRTIAVHVIFSLSRYGYYDQYGQLKIVNYMADPVSGYSTDIDPIDPNNVG